MSLCSVEKNKINQYVIKKFIMDKFIGKQIKSASVVYLCTSIIQPAVRASIEGLLLFFMRPCHMVESPLV